MKKTLILIPLILSLLFLCLSLRFKNNIHSFDSSAVLKNIERFSSNNYRGRLAGTTENDQTAFVLKEYLKAENLKPLDGDFYDDFTTNVPMKIDGKPYLRVTDASGKIIKEFNYGTDFKEDMLNFKANSFSFSNKDELGLQDSVLQVTKDSNHFIFYVPQGTSFSFRSSFMDNSLHSMYIITSDKAFLELKDFITKGHTINCFMPYEVKNTKLNNVAGFIRGKDPNSPPIVISAHFDHIGSDLSGNVFPGALDNASGTSFVMELEKYLKSLGKPKRNVLFVFFNGEELGLQGSTHFAKEYKDYLSKSKVFNFDMIGSNNNVPLTIMGGVKDSNKNSLVKEISAVCTYNKVKYNTLFEDSSDHAAFRNNNIQSITFCEDDLTRIHTPDDKANFISTKSIDRCFEVASDEIVKSAYSNNLMLTYYDKIILYSSISSGLFFIAYILISLKIRSSKKK